MSLEHSVELRLIEPQEAAALRQLRIRAVTEHPSAFGASSEEERALSVEQVAQQLREGPPISYWFGAFEQATLAGILNLVRFQRPKVCHKAMLGGMYVASDAQGRGVGRALLEHALSFASTQDGLELITLAVTVGNAAARKLYVGAGFRPYGVEPRYIRVDTSYFDIEWMILDLRDAAHTRA